MKKIETMQEYEQFIADNPIALVYYSTLLCGVCHVMKPQVESLVSLYPDVKMAEVVMDELPEISAQQTIFSSPAVIVYLETKEFIRQAGYLRLDQLDSMLQRLT